MMLSESLGHLLYRCSIIKALRDGLSLHGALFKCGFQADMILSNRVVNMYAKSGCISSAHKVFDEMPERNVVSWAALISGYDQAQEPVMALQLYFRMPLVPNEFIFASVISACASLSYLTHGQQVHAQALKLGYASVSFVSNAIISLYMRCGLCDDAITVFSSKMIIPNSVSYNSMIAGFVKNGQPIKGLQVFRSMHQQGFIPDRFTYAGVLRACTDTDDLQKGRELHCKVIKLKLDSTPFIGNVIMSMYAKFNLTEEAEKAFNLIEGKDIISWNTIIAACSHTADYVKGLGIFKELLKETTVMPDDFTFSSVLAACAGIASIFHGKQMHAHLIRQRCYEDIGVENALLNMYAKCGCIRYAYTIFNIMNCPNLVSWNSIIAAFGHHGLGKKALELFEQMKKMRVKPDYVTFIGLLIACNHAGLVDEGQNLFDSMVDCYGIGPGIEHVSSLIDMLGRAGRLDHVERYVKKFPVSNDPIILGSLLSACRLQGEVVAGELLGEKLLELLPGTTSPFVLLSNLYAADKIWRGVVEVRKMLKSSGLKKEPGHSLIEVNGVVEKFTVGDFSHSWIEEIKGILITLSLADGFETLDETVVSAK
ncbi:hypothetical protein Ancab_035752 [Ancistrocladus abbreviatus]